MKIEVNLPNDSYAIEMERGILKQVGYHCNLNRKVLVVTDTGVPEAYAKMVIAQCKDAVLAVIGEGEKNKSLESFMRLQKMLLEYSFTRKDCVVAVGGGVVGDLAGFVAASYMRGIDFYNIPTTVLSQVDSSVGGKTAVNFEGVKNVIGAFYQPKKVLIDPVTLKTLPQRQVSNGLAEALKMSLTFDEELFETFETCNEFRNLDTIIASAVQIKKRIVEEDEKEKNIRKALNFGHTIGHGIEAISDGRLYHGECVALGMLAMCSDEVRERLIPVMKKLGLPVTCRVDVTGAVRAIEHDKKSEGKTIATVYVPTVGSYEFKDADMNTIYEKIKMVAEDM